jgi:hypothetical protein
METSPEWRCFTPETAAAHAALEPELQLLAAVMLQALKDAQGPSGTHREAARHWLASPACGELCVVLGLAQSRILALLAEGGRIRRHARVVH